MEENDKNLQEETPQEQSAFNQTTRPRVGFPEQRPTEKSGSKLLTIIILVLLVVAGGVGIWFLLRGRAEEKIVSEPTTPTSFIEQSSPTPTPEEVAKKDIKIQVLNGTGITGGAGDLKKELEEIGFSNIEVGNADNKSYTKTKVTFDESLASSVKEEILNKLEEIYASVDSETKSLSRFDIEIITGYPKGHTPTPTAKPTASPTPTSTGTITVTPTTTSTPTPTP